MGIVHEPGKKPLTPPPPPTWGEVAPVGERVFAVSFVLPNRWVAYPLTVLARWEHRTTPTESLTLHFGSDRIEIEGTDLDAVVSALAQGRLRELRPNFDAPKRPGPQIRRISLESP